MQSSQKNGRESLKLVSISDLKNPSGKKQDYLLTSSVAYRNFLPERPEKPCSIYLPDF